MSRSASHRSSLLLGLCMVLGACSPPDELEITQLRPIRDVHAHLQPGASGEARFGGGMGGAAQSMAQSQQAASLDYDLPEGWEELELTSMRLVNLRPAGDPQAECSVIVLGGNGGGLAANINRWRSQIGLGAISEGQVNALPSALLMGQSATLVDLRGNYSGMGDSAQSDWGLLGLVLVAERGTVFVKMTGPAQLITEEREAFEQFCASLHAAGPGHNHADHADHADAPDQADPTSPASTPPADSPAMQPSTPDGRFGYSLPDGWQSLAPKSMRNINLKAGSSSECYLIALAGEGGGLEMNINRWRGEVGLDPLSASQIGELPQVSLLDTQAPLLEVSGDYQGMGGPTGAAKRVLGVALIRPNGSLFIKMVGPDAEVSAERERFIAFVQSLSER